MLEFYLSDGSNFSDQKDSDNFKTWKEVKLYIENNNLTITKLLLNNGQTQVSLFEDYISKNTHAGFFHAKKIAKISQSKDCLHFYLLGIILGDEIYIQEWNVPNLILTNVEKRPLISTNKACLIYNENFKKTN